MTTRSEDMSNHGDTRQANACCMPSVYRAFVSREYYGSKTPYCPLLGQFSNRNYECRTIAGCGSVLVSPTHFDRVPLFALDYSSDGVHVAVADEEGYITIADTTQILQAADADESVSRNFLAQKAQFESHNNAVFDVKWSHEGTRLITASGDQTIRVWDATRVSTLSEGGADYRMHPIIECRGHTGSVKSIATLTECMSVIASGARDGSVRVWDLRQPHFKNASNHCQVCLPLNCVDDAHKNAGVQSRKGKYKWIGESKQSVTAVIFSRDGGILLTGGASDGVVKLWDLRKMTQSFASLDCHANYCNDDLQSQRVENRSRTHGISSLALDVYGSGLAASCVDSTIYVFDILQAGSRRGPLRRLTGHRTKSFYAKIDYSTEGSRILSGGGDGCAYVWDIGRNVSSKCDETPMILKGHEGEVTGVRWSPLDLCTVATIADDSTLKMWKAQRAAHHSHKSNSESDNRDQQRNLTHSNLVRDRSRLRNLNTPEVFNASNENTGQVSIRGADHHIEKEVGRDLHNQHEFNKSWLQWVGIDWQQKDLQFLRSRKSQVLAQDRKNKQPISNVRNEGKLSRLPLSTLNNTPPGRFNVPHSTKNQSQKHSSDHDGHHDTDTENEILHDGMCLPENENELEMRKRRKTIIDYFSPTDCRN